jgi:two-component system NarL family sensor kinase
MKKIKKIEFKKIICCLILLFTNLSFSQQKDIDSVQKILKGKLTLSERALKMKDLAMYYEVVDTLQAIKLYDKALEFSLKNDLLYEAGVVVFNKSFVYTQNANYKKSQQCLEEALLYFKKSKNEKTPLKTAQVYNAISNNYRHLNNFKQSVAYQLKAISIYKKIDNYPSLLISYINLSNNYKEIQEFEKQEEYGRKALECAKKTGVSLDYFVSNFTISYALTMMNEYQKALEYSNEAKKYYSDKYSPVSLISFHLISGLINMNLKKLNEAENDFSQSLKIAENSKQVFSVIQSKIQLARVLTLQKKFTEAEKILKSAEIEINKTGERSQRFVLIDYFSRLYDESGDYKKALQYYKIYDQIKDSLSSTENKHYLSDLETKYNIQKKDKEILLLEKSQLKQKTFIYSLSAIALGLLLFSFLLYRNYNARKKISEQEITQLQQEKKIDAAQNMIQGEETERTRLARDLHDGLGGMLSGVKFQLNSMKGNVILSEENAETFTRSITQLDNAIAEMRRVAHNMMPEALLKFGLNDTLKDYCESVSQNSGLAVTFQSFGLENRVDQTTEIVLYRSVQELLNNIVKHAKATQAQVQFSRIGNVISLTVEDNGKGFDVNNLSKKGIGLSNIQNRVDYLNGKMDIKSDEKGTSTHIEFELT